jgi:hypothetical protein
LIDIGDMVLDRMDRNEELLIDLSVAFSLEDELKDAGFT